MKLYIGIYVTVGLLLCFLSGLYMKRSPTKEGEGDQSDALMWVVWLWPLGAVILLVLFPYWGPIYIRNLVWWARDTWNKRDAINHLMGRIQKRPDK